MSDPTRTAPAATSGPAPVAAHPSPSYPRLTRAAAAVSLAAPLLVLASELLAPRGPGGLDAVEEMAWVTGHADRFAASYLVGMLAAAALAGMFILLGTRATGRGGVVGRVAAVIGTLGAVGLGEHLATALFVREVYLSDAASDAVARAVDAAGGLATVATLVPLIFGTTLGVLLLAVSALRAGWVRWWVVVVAALAFLADFSPTSWNTVLYATLTSVVVGAIVVGLRRLD